MCGRLNISGSSCNHRACALWGVCNYLWVTDRPANRLGDLAKIGFDSGVVALQSYATLCQQNLVIKRVNYKIRPKWHSFCHLVFGLQFSDENSRGHKTLSEESTLGYLTRLASACHGKTVATRFFSEIPPVSCNPLGPYRQRRSGLSPPTGGGLRRQLGSKAPKVKKNSQS